MRALDGKGEGEGENVGVWNWDFCITENGSGAICRGCDGSSVIGTGPTRLEHPLVKMQQSEPLIDFVLHAIWMQAGSRCRERFIIKRRGAGGRGV